MPDHTAFKIDSLTVNPGSTWWSVASKDAGLLSLSLCCVALYCQMRHGINLQIEAFHFASEGLKAINRAINGPTDESYDSLIGAIVLASGCEVCFIRKDAE